MSEETAKQVAAQPRNQERWVPGDRVSYHGHQGTVLHIMRRFLVIQWADSFETAAIEMDAGSLQRVVID